MVHQKCTYVRRKGKTYYFTRRIPKELQRFCGLSRFETCLHTSDINSARRQALMLSQELEEHWSILRRKNRSSRIARVFGSAEQSSTADLKKPSSSAPLLSLALETYVNLKGAGRSKTFEAGARRSIGYLLEVTEDKHLDYYDRADANAFREFLKGRSLTQDSIARNITNVRAVINFALREHGLPPNQAFSGVYLGENVPAKKRYVPSVAEVHQLQRECRYADDPSRWILALIADTGLRLSEAIGLCRDDIDLDQRLPYLIVRPHPWRRLKTLSSERKVPLVGSSLWAAKRALEVGQGQFVFPRYCNMQEAMANSASAALNKWMKCNISQDMVIHSLRHAMRDRLRNVECPPDIIDAIGGWSRQGIGETYGLGHDLSILSKWLKKVTTGDTNLALNS